MQPTPMPDNVTRLLHAARLRASHAAHTVATIEADIARLTAIPSPAEESLIGKFEALLAARVTEHNAARRDLAELEAQPRWLLEQRLMTRRVFERQRVAG